MWVKGQNDNVGMGKEHIHPPKVVGQNVVLDIFYFHPYLGKIPILTIFQMGWNHQLAVDSAIWLFSNSCDGHVAPLLLAAGDLCGGAGSLRP